MKPPAPLALLGILLLTCPAITRAFVIPEGMSETDGKRFKPFQTFQIRGVCGDRDLERLAKSGVNTVRGYTMGEPAAVRESLLAAAGTGG